MNRKQVQLLFTLILKIYSNLKNISTWTEEIFFTNFPYGKPKNIFIPFSLLKRSGNTSYNNEKAI